MQCKTGADRRQKEQLRRAGGGLAQQERHASQVERENQAGGRTAGDDGDAARLGEHTQLARNRGDEPGIFRKTPPADQHQGGIGQAERKGLDREDDNAPAADGCGDGMAQLVRDGAEKNPRGLAKEWRGQAGAVRWRQAGEVDHHRRKAVGEGEQPGQRPQEGGPPGNFFSPRQGFTHAAT